MVKRLLDVILASIGMLVLSPLFIMAALGIRWSSPGPLLYRAQRMGRSGKVFTMYKFRTMHVDHDAFNSAITTQDDPRISRMGSFLRKSKIDELPQLVNVLKGDMAIVGPRPEDPDIVENYYTPSQLETLEVRPGLASPGSIYVYTHGQKLVQQDQAHRSYAEKLLPVKLALDLVYVRKASLFYDIRIMGRCLWIITSTLLGRKTYPLPPEMNHVEGLLYPFRLN